MKFRIVLVTALLAGGVPGVQASPKGDGENRRGFTWEVDAAQGYDNNIKQAPSGEERGSSVTSIRPSLHYAGAAGSARYSIDYAPHFRYYGRDTDHNRLDHRLTASRHQRLGADAGVKLDLRGRRWTRPVNKGNRIADEQGDIQETVTVGGRYEKSFEGRSGALMVGVAYRWNRYANNRTTASTVPGVSGSNTQSEDYDSPRLKAGLSWNPTPTTRLLLQGRYSDFRYQWAGSSLSSHDAALLAGIAWKPDKAVSARILAGPLRKDFDSSEIASREITYWDGGVSFRLGQRARLDLSSRRRFEEGSELEVGKIRQSVTERTTHRARLSHRLTPRIRIAVGYLNRIKEYRGGVTNGGRNDISIRFLHVVRELSRDFDIGLELREKRNDSTFPDASYTRRAFFLTLQYR